MKFLIAFFASIFLAASAFAVDVQMGYDGNLVFACRGNHLRWRISPFRQQHAATTQRDCEDHDELSHDALAMMPGEEFDIAFPDAGVYTYWCGPHKGAGMIGTVTVE